MKCFNQPDYTELSRTKQPGQIPYCSLEWHRPKANDKLTANYPNTRFLSFFDVPVEHGCYERQRTTPANDWKHFPKPKIWIEIEKIPWQTVRQPIHVSRSRESCDDGRIENRGGRFTILTSFSEYWESKHVAGVLSGNWRLSNDCWRGVPSGGPCCLANDAGSRADNALLYKTCPEAKGFSTRSMGSLEPLIHRGCGLPLLLYHPEADGRQVRSRASST